MAEERGGLWGKNLTAHDLTEKHYQACINELQLGLNQLRSMGRGEHQHCCAVCGDNDHTAEQCWLHNPLLAAALGWEALAGPFWRCFHCNAVFTTEETAEAHFGKSPKDVPECLRQLAELKQLWHCPDCDEHFITAELTVTDGTHQPACPDCGHEVGLA